MAEDVETALTRLAPQAALIADEPENGRALHVDRGARAPPGRRRHSSGAPGPAQLVDRGLDRPDPPWVRRGEARRIRRSFACWCRASIGRSSPRISTAVPDTLRSLVFAALVGDAPASLYDLRREVEEQIIEWSPVEAAARVQEEVARGAGPRADARGGRRRLGRARARRSAPADGRCRSGLRLLASTFDEKRMPILLFVGPRGSGKTALVRRIARGLLDRSRGKGATAPAVGDERGSHRRRHGLSRHVAAALPRRSSRSSKAAATCSTSIASPT